MGDILVNSTSSHPDNISSTLKSINFSRFSNIKNMLENTGFFGGDYMYLLEIIFFHEKIEKLYSQYNGIRKIKWNITYARSWENNT